MNFGGIVRVNKTALCVIFLICVLFYYVFSDRTVTLKTSGRLINLVDLFKTALNAAENGGREIIKVKDFLSIKIKGLTNEGLKDPVTTADFNSHCAMVQTIKQQFPNLHIISEESKTICKEQVQLNDSNLQNLQFHGLSDEWVAQDDITLWIDPLDATYEFTEKLYQYVTTMVCIAINGKPVIGVIHDPFLKTSSWAWVGKGKSEDLNLKSKQEEPNDQLKITISRSHSGSIKEILDKNFQDYKLFVAAGAGYKSLLVAKGKVDAYIHITMIKKWDICAGDAILTALGGKMTTKGNSPIDYKYSSSTQNTDGIIGTLKNHILFIDKLL